MHVYIHRQKKRAKREKLEYKKNGLLMGSNRAGEEEIRSNKCEEWRMRWRENSLHSDRAEGESFQHIRLQTNRTIETFFLFLG